MAGKHCLQVMTLHPSKLVKTYKEDGRLTFPDIVIEPAYRKCKWQLLKSYSVKICIPFRIISTILKQAMTPYENIWTLTDTMPSQVNVCIVAIEQILQREISCLKVFGRTSIPLARQINVLFQVCLVCREDSISGYQSKIISFSTF